MSKALDKLAVARGDFQKKLDVQLAPFVNKQLAKQEEKKLMGYLEDTLSDPRVYYGNLVRDTLTSQFDLGRDASGVRPNITRTPFDQYIGQEVRMPSGHVGTVKGFFQGPSGLQFVFADGTTENAPGGYTMPSSVDAVLYKLMGSKRYGALSDEQKKNLTDYYSSAGVQTLIDDFAKQNEQFATQKKIGDEALDYLKKTLDPRLYSGYKQDQLDQFRTYYGGKGLDVLKTDVEKLNQGRKAQDEALDYLKNNAFSGLYSGFKPEQLNEFGQYYGNKGIDTLKTDLQKLNSNYFESQLQDAMQKQQQRQAYEQSVRRNQFAQSFGIPTKAGQQPVEPPPQFNQQDYVSRLSAPVKSTQKPAVQPTVQPAVQPAPNTPIQPAVQPTPSGGKFSKLLQPVTQPQQPAPSSGKATSNAFSAAAKNVAPQATPIKR